MAGQSDVPPLPPHPAPKKMYELKSNLRTPPIVSRPECLPELPGAVTAAAAATKQRMFISKIYGCLTSIRFGGHQRGNKRGCDLMIQSFEGRDPEQYVLPERDGPGLLPSNQKMVGFLNGIFNLRALWARCHCRWGRIVGASSSSPSTPVSLK